MYNSSKLVSVKWCDTHKDWYIKAWLSQWELIQSNLIKHLKWIHLYADSWEKVTLDQGWEMKVYGDNW